MASAVIHLAVAKELEKNYSSRIVSRIMGNNIRLEFLGSDIRQKLMLDHIKSHKK